MKIGNVSIWMGAKEAASYGATHHARLFGIVPGFYGEGSNIWIGRSDLLNPFEDVLAFVWSAMRAIRGEEPDFMFEVGKPLA